MDLGQAQRGVDMGPSAIRYAELSNRLDELGYSVTDAGNIGVPIRDSLPGANVLPSIIKTCEQIYKAGYETCVDNSIPLFLGGDHSIAIGTIGGISNYQRTGVIWVDAHGDYNTPETSKSMNVHGMPLAVLLGKGLPELVNIGSKGAKLQAEDVVLIGLRDLDHHEKNMLKRSGVLVFTMRDIDEIGMHTVTKKSLKHLTHVERLHLSLDMDSIDPVIAPGVGTPVNGGLTIREAHLLMEMIADTKQLKSMDLVEINPILDTLNQTASLAVDLTVSAFGKSIL